MAESQHKSAEAVVSSMWDNIFAGDAPSDVARRIMIDALRMWIRQSVASKLGFANFLDTRHLPPESERDIERISNALQELIDDLIRGRLSFRQFLTACKVHARVDWGVELI